MAKIKDLSGMKFGKLTVIERGQDIYYGKDSQKRITWICKCDCGNIKQITGCSLRNNSTQSCGCIQTEKSKIRRERQIEKYKDKHQYTVFDKRLHNIWKGMKERCYTKTCAYYKYYGGRGIIMCDEWRKRGGFWTFRGWALNNGYQDNLQIDRIDVNQGYNPENCRWVTAQEQANNKRNSIKIEVDGVSHSLLEWSQILHMDFSRMVRLKKQDYELLVNEIGIRHKYEQIVNYESLGLTNKEKSL